MNSIWFFGDSFTAGYGTDQNSEYYIKYGPGRTFDYLLAEYYNSRVYNFGVPGCSNNTILTSITDNLSNFKSGDRVIIGNTSPLRDLVPNKEGTKLIDQKLFDSTPYPDSLAYKNDNLEMILRSYCIEFKTGHIPLWNAYYNRLFLNILKYLDSKNISGLLWDYSVWSEEQTQGMKFENIYQHTNETIYDLHWSFNGHQQVFEWIKTGLEKGKKFIK